MRRAALAVGLGCTLATSAAVAAEVDVGGYHDEALRAAQNAWLGSSLGVAEGASRGPVPLVVRSGDESALTAFTPRFGGLGLGMGGGAPHHAAVPSNGSGDATASGMTGAAPSDAGQVEVGLKDTSTVAGMAVDWSAKAGVGHEPPAQAGEPSSFVVGGELAVSGVRFDAAYGERATVLGVSGDRMTAGLAYGIGPVDTRVSYSVVSSEDETQASMVTVGSRLTLQPGLSLQGDLAYAEEKKSGDAATAGVVSLRFNF